MSKAPKHMIPDAAMPPAHVPVDAGSADAPAQLPAGEPEPAVPLLPGEVAPRHPAPDVLGVLRRALVFLAIAGVAAVVSNHVVCSIGEGIGGFSNGSEVNRFWIAQAFATLFLGGSLWCNRDWFETKPHNLYLVIVLTVTMLFSFGISVRTVGWDIGVHVRNIITFADWEGNIARSEADLSLIEVRHMVHKKEGLLKTIDATERSLGYRDRLAGDVVKHKNTPLWYVTGVEYLPYALVLNLCRALGATYAVALVAVRMVGGVIYSLVTYAGMRKLRSGKMLYAVAALIPTNVFLAAEFGYSYWLLGFVLYGFATLAGMIQGSVEVRPRTLVAMLAALFVGMLPRVVYFPLMFLCLLIPTERFSSRRVAYVYRGLLVGAALVALGTWLVPRLMAGFGTGDRRGGGAVDPTAQIAYILEHPAEYASTLFRLLLPPFAMQGGGADVEGVSPISGLLSLEAMPGLVTNYGYLPRPDVAYSVVVGIVLLAALLLDKDPDCRTGWVAGTMAVVIALVVVAMTATALYIDFTPVGLDQINGVQRRYLLPLLYPLLLFVGPALRVRVPRGALNAAVLCAMTAVLLDSWWVCAMAPVA